MSTFHIERELLVPRPLHEVFPFFSDPRNLESITPPWLSFRVREAPGEPLQEGSRISYRLKLHGIPFGWTSLISKWEPPYTFVDEQLRGPFRLWRHTHSFESVGDETLVRDKVDYAMVGGRLINSLFVRRDLKRVFDYRAERLTVLMDMEPSLALAGGPLK